MTPATETAAPASSAPPPAAEFPVPPDRDFFRLASELMPEVGNVNPVVRTEPLAIAVGHRETLKLVDLEAPELYESEFELRLVTPNAYWLVEDRLEVSQDDLERSAAEFEETIYPLVAGAFGSEWKPGVDGDPRLYIINASLRGVGGYFSAADEYPKALRPVSNERESIYINTRYLPVGTPLYAHVLAHELQHAIHWNADRSEDTWVNEGLSELAVTVTGHGERSITAFRRAGPTSLTIWPGSDVGGAENYGAASLFMHYLTEHYGGRQDLRPLLSQPADGIPGINAYLEALGHGITFADVFRDWAAANLLDEDSGPYGYSTMAVSFPVYRGLKTGSDYESTIPQFANEYVRLEQSDSPLRLSFEGDTETRLLPEDAGDGCWWSNRGDVIDSTLTATLDLRETATPSLDYQVWYAIEEDWDFAYVEVSTDKGKTWAILETPLTSADDPLDVSFGPGYTGNSDRWLDDSVALEQWAGREIMVRFQYITDAAINDHGLCLRSLRLSDAGKATATPLDWTPNGFAWTTNRVKQNFIVQVAFQGKEGTANRVLQLSLDESNRGGLTLEPDAQARRIVAIVQPTAPATRLPATYRLKLEPAE